MPEYFPNYTSETIMTTIDQVVTEIEEVMTSSQYDLRRLVASKRWDEAIDKMFASAEGTGYEKKTRIRELLKMLDKEVSNNSIISDLLVAFMFEIDPGLRGEDASVESLLVFFSSSADESSKHLVIELICIVFELWSLDEVNKSAKAVELLEGFLFIETATNFWFMVRGHTLEVSAIDTGGDIMAKRIYQAAKSIENGLANVVTPFVTKSINSAGSYAKDRIEPSSGDDSDNDGTGNLPTSLSDDVVNATDKFRRGSQIVAFGVRDVSTKGIASVAKKWEDNGTTAHFVQDEELRALMTAAGKIGIAALGATAIVSESIFETTKEGQSLSHNLPWLLLFY